MSASIVLPVLLDPIHIFLVHIRVKHCDYDCLRSARRSPSRGIGEKPGKKVEENKGTTCY